MSLSIKTGQTPAPNTNKIFSKLETKMSSLNLVKTKKSTAKITLSGIKNWMFLLKMEKKAKYFLLLLVFKILKALIG